MNCLVLIIVMIMVIARMLLVCVGRAIVDLLVKLVSVKINVQVMDRIYYYFYLSLDARRGNVTVLKDIRVVNVSIDNFCTEKSKMMAL